MVSSATEYVYTVQTPAPVNKLAEGDPDGLAFHTYLRQTIRRLLQTNRRGIRILPSYYRLIVVDKVSIENEKEKIGKFLEILGQELQEYFQKLQKKKKPFPKLDTIFIGIVNADIVSRCFFSNIDIHITGRKNYVLAFQEKIIEKNIVKKQRLLLWKGSIHIDDPRGDILRGELRKIFGDKLWPGAVDHGNQGEVVNLGENIYLGGLNSSNWFSELHTRISQLNDDIGVLIESVGSEC